MKKVLSSLLISLFALTLHAQDRSDTLHVAHYDINLSVVDFSGKTLSGNTVLDVVPKMSQLENIILDLAAFTVDSVKVDGIRTNYRHLSPRLEISLPAFSVEGDTLQIAIYYHGIPEKDPRWGGFYFSGEYAFNMGVAMTRIPHNYGRCWYPCLDLFTDKSTYRCNIRTTSEKMAICGGVLIDTTHLDDNTIVWHWDLAQPIPTYLASVAVGNYDVYRDTIQGVEKRIPIEIFTAPSLINKMPESFANLYRIIRRYEQIFGPYQFDKVGYVAVNFNGGAMEHATNISYPNFAIDGTLDYQSLLAHELAHSWFGNLYTCDKAEEMWLNEGFARYCEILIDEFLYHDEDPELDPAKVGFRDLHRSVLKSAHTDDGGYFALNNIPQAVTYGTTAYDKGGLIAHTLRHYMSDALFFGGLQELFQTYAFQNLNSAQFFNFLSQSSGIDMTAFFDAFVDQPGFLHYSIDSIRFLQEPNQYQVHLKQRLHHAERFGNENRVELTFFGSNGALHTQQVIFSGEHGIVEVMIPFAPVFGVVDYYEKIADAVVDYNLAISTTGSKSCTSADCIITTNEIEGEAFLRVEHNLVTPDSLKKDNPNIYRISNNHYWRIEYLSEDNFEGIFQFRFATSSNSLNYELLQGYTIDDLLLLYRRDASDDWRMIPFLRSGNSIGYMKTTQFLPGEYTFAVGKYDVGISSPDKSELQLFPNPAKTELQYCLPAHFGCNKVEILDTSGKIVQSLKVKAENSVIHIGHLPVGCYFIRFSGKDRSLMEKFIKE